MLTAHKVTIHIIEEFIAIDIAVVIRRRNGQRMIIKQPRTETADNEVMPLKRLMDRRRLMYPARYWFKIMNAERKWITASVPSDNVKRMMTIVNAIDPAPLFRADQKIPFFIVRRQLLRSPDIPFAIGRILQQLTVRTKISFWITDRTKGLDDKKTIVIPV